MEDKIRRIKESDFQEVSALYNYRKSVKELKWLFTDPNDSSIYNGFVAINDKNQIIGVIGYASSLFVKNGIEMEGVIFMSWIVSLNYRGFAGVSLLKKVSRLGDFSIAIAGSKLGQSFYSMLKYKYKSKSDIYYKVLNIKDLFNSLEKSSLVKKLGMIGFLIPSYFKNSSQNSKYKDVEFIYYHGDNFVKEKEFGSVFKKKITKNYIDWLLDCPLLNTYAFKIKINKNYIGICVLYIKMINNVKRGRIVHLPFLGFDKELWNSVIEKCITFFKKEECCIVTGMAHYDLCRTGYKESGFMKIERHNSPIYIKDFKQILGSINMKDWFLQYSEGDKAYRDL